MTHRSADRSWAPQVHRTASPAAVRDWVRHKRRRVIVFTGFSASGYADPSAMAEQALRVLAPLDPSRWLVAAGATAAGIGAVYPLAKARGFGTLGIVSSRALASDAPFSPDCDTVFVIDDTTWGGARPGGRGLTPTSRTLVAVADRLVALGGGPIAQTELHAARRAGVATLAHSATPARP